MKLPRISLVTPSFQQGSFLESAIQSVRGQRYADLEWLVLDGGSTDASAAILQKYESHFAYWRSVPDGGQAAALAEGFARATGDMLGWLNADDMLDAGALDAVGTYFAEHPECEFVSGDGVFVNADDSRVEYTVKVQEYSFAQLLHFCDDVYLPQPSVFFSRRAYEQVGGLDKTLNYAMDLDLWLRMRQQVPLHHIPHNFSKMRLHENAKTERDHFAALAEAERVTRRYWDRVGSAERARIFLGWRTMYARAYCDLGLKCMRQGDRRGGWYALGMALVNDPLILRRRDARKLLGRLVFR